MDYFLFCLLIILLNIAIRRKKNKLTLLTRFNPRYDYTMNRCSTKKSHKKVFIIFVIISCKSIDRWFASSESGALSFGTVRQWHASSYILNFYEMKTESEKINTHNCHCIKHFFMQSKVIISKFPVSRISRDVNYLLNAFCASQ